MRTLLIIIQIVLAIVMIAAILMQPSKTTGLGNMITGTTETFYSKNKSRTYEAMLARITIVTSILFAIVVVVLNKV